MKRIIVIASLVMFTVVSAYAQKNYYVGGSFGIAAETDNSISSFTVSVSPEVGFYLSDKTIIGISTSVASLTTNQRGFSTMFGDTEINYEGDGDCFTFAIAPYLRYHLMDLGQIKLWAQGAVAHSIISFGEFKGISTSLSVAPVLTWKANEHFDLFTTLNVFSASLFRTRLRDTSKKETLSDVYGFSCGASTYNLLSPSLLTIGFVYSFGR